MRHFVLMLVIGLCSFNLKADEKGQYFELSWQHRGSPLSILEHSPDIVYLERAEGTIGLNEYTLKFFDRPNPVPSAVLWLTELPISCFVKCNKRIFVATVYSAGRSQICLNNFYVHILWSAGTADDRGLFYIGDDVFNYTLVR